MELIFNDLSIHGQFHDIATFGDAIGRVMAIRKMARQFGRELQCHRNVANAQVTRDLTMPQIANALGRDRCRVLMQWLTQRGPFWEDFQQHTGDDYLECNGEIVTETAVGEAAYCRFSGIDRSLVSMDPSRWLASPLTVDWRENGQVRSVGILNYWDADAVKIALENCPATLESWNDLESVARSRCQELTFSKDSFEPLNGVPFAKGAAEQLLSRLTVLHDFKNCFDERGERTPRCQEIFQKHFTGDEAWFSDASPTEKAEFRTALTFHHPTNSRASLFCTWHGKVRTQYLRIHFSWPVRASEPLYVVYIGPKITKR